MKDFFPAAEEARQKFPLAWAAAVFVLALAVRFVPVLENGQYRHQRRYEVERVGISLATSGRFADPFQTPTGYTAHVSPGFPILLCIIFRFFGTGTHGELAKEFLGCLISALQYGLLVLAAFALGMPRRVGIVAGFLGAVLPLKWPTETLGDWEANAAGVFLIFLVTITVRSWRQPPAAGRRAFLHGLFWGCAGLFSPALLTVQAGLAAAGLWIGQNDLGRRLRLTVLMLLGTLAALAPWGVRNWVRLGSPILTRSNFGMELYVSNNDLAAADMMRNRLSLDTYHPFTNPTVAAEILKQGEVAFNNGYEKLAVNWICRHPARFASLTLERVKDFWFPRYPPFYKEILLSLLTLGGFAGLIRLARKDRVAASALWTVCLTFPLLYYVIQSMPRYKYPIDWISLLATVYALLAV